MAHAGFDRPLFLERYDTVMLARYGVIGLREPPASFDPACFEENMSDAMRLLDVVPSVACAVRALVWSVTPLDVEGPEYDTGYSDPAVPFSIFIGAHSRESSVAPIRLAEGVLHEAMHLQLSLIEDLMPLVNGNGARRHSPWQDRQRPIQGILHGLYVFRVVQDWLRVLLMHEGVTISDVEHAMKRVRQIDDECRELSDLSTNADLTTEGRVLATALV